MRKRIKEPLQELKKVVSDNIAVLEDKLRPRFRQFASDEDERQANSHSSGELWAYRQVLSEINRQLGMVQHETDCDEVACEVSYEMEPGDDSISVRVRQGIFDHVKTELLSWRNRDINWKYDKGRKIAAAYMYDKQTGGGEL